MGELSVIVPCKDAADILPLTLAALLREKERGHIREILLIDNGSSDASPGIARRYGVEVLTCSGTIGSARNTGAQRSTATYLCFVDADVEVASGWSDEVISFITYHSGNTSNLLFGNTYHCPEHPTWVERTWARSLWRRDHQNYINGGNLICSRPLFFALNGFDPRAITGEDVDLCRRAAAIGYPPLRHTHLRVTHHGYPKTLRAFYRRERWHGYSMALHLKRPHQSRPLLLAFATLLFPCLAVASALYEGLAATVPFVTITATASAGLLLLWCARRLGEFVSKEPVRLAALFTVYAVARTHSLIDILLHPARYAPASSLLRFRSFIGPRGLRALVHGGTRLHPVVHRADRLTIPSPPDVRSE